MSKNNNVNPGQYKVGGRERQGENFDPALERAKLAKNVEHSRTGTKSARGAPTALMPTRSKRKG